MDEALLSLRKQYNAFGRGSLEFLYPDNTRSWPSCARYGEERILVVANLSRFSQHAELSLPSAARPLPRRDVRPQRRSRRSARRPTPSRSGPHGFFWFALEKAPRARRAARVPPLRRAWPTVAVDGVLAEHFAEALARASRRPRRRPPVAALVLGQVARARSGPRWLDVVAASASWPRSPSCTWTTSRASRSDTSCPVAAALGRAGEELAARNPGAVLARLDDARGAAAGVLYDAVCDRGFCEALLDVMGRRSAIKGLVGELEGWSDRQIRQTRALAGRPRAGAGDGRAGRHVRHLRLALHPAPHPAPGGGAPRPRGRCSSWPSTGSPTARPCAA